MFIGGQRGAAVATQVVEAHHAPVRVFEQRLRSQQALRILQRQRDLLARFVTRGMLREPLAVAAAHALARRVDPFEQLGPVVVVQPFE